MKHKSFSAFALIFALVAALAPGASSAQFEFKSKKPAAMAPAPVAPIQAPAAVAPVPAPAPAAAPAAPAVVAPQRLCAHLLRRNRLDPTLRHQFF